MLKEDLNKLAKSLTLEEKIGQLVQLGGQFFDNNNGIMTGPMEELGISEDKLYQIGSILNTTGAKQIIKIQNQYLERNEKKIPLLFMADIINGFKTIFPISLGLGCSFNPKLIQKTAEIAAKEAAVSGAHVTFSPMVDLVRDARWGRVMESYGEDTYLNCQYAQAMVKGYQENNNPDENILSCVKHFAGYGAPIAGREYNTVDISERSLRQDYLPAYKSAIDAGCHLVMTSFNTIDNIPATANKFLLKDILRDEWNFKGTVISDFSSVKELINHGIAANDEEAAKLSLEAGCDIDMMTSVYMNNLKNLIEKKQLNIKYIDDAVMRVLELKNELGLFENPYRGANVNKESQIIMCPEFRKIARETVRKTCVLLKNNQVLPLNKNQKIALIGPYVDSTDMCGVWSINVDSSKVVTLKQGFEKQADKDCLTVIKGCPISEDLNIAEKLGGFVTKKQNDEEIDIESELQNALDIARNSEVIVLAIGEHPLQSGEGAARMELTIPKIQINLLKRLRQLNKPIVSLVFSGRPLVLKEVVENSDSVLQCWFPGTEAGDGIADIIYGKENPSARLSMSFPYSVGQCPIYYNHFNTGRPASTDGSINRFTSRYIDGPNEPYFPFGYGLSYSKYDYSCIQLSTKTLTIKSSIKATVTVTNISEISGEETVQLYIRDLVGSVVRPVKELKGFKKIFLNPHESKNVTFEIREDMLRFYTRDMIFDSENGNFEIYIGHYSSTKNKEIFSLIKEL